MTRLSLTSEEAASYQRDLDAILGFVDRLARVDTTGVPEQDTVHRVGEPRSDVYVEQYSTIHDLIVQNFPETVGGMLKVPAVFEKPKGSYVSS